MTDAAETHINFEVWQDIFENKEHILLCVLSPVPCVIAIFKIQQRRKRNYILRLPTKE
jgi:hypothetical protein